MVNKINAKTFIYILIILTAFALTFIFAKNIQTKNINTNVNNVIIEGKEPKIDINKADKSELMSIEGIGDKKADLIINNRPYKSIWDLERIKGISENYIQQIKDKITVNN